MSDKVIIYSDGGSDPNPGIGGWAAILRFGEHEKVLTGNDPDTTNNRMELQAAIGALSALKRPCSIEFYTDSEYVRKGITEWIEGWAANNWQKKGKPIRNADLWRTLWPLVKKHEIDWHWVKGHAGNEYNERCDQLARQARLEITPDDQIDPNMPKVVFALLLQRKSRARWVGCGLGRRWGDGAVERNGRIHDQQPHGNHSSD